MEVICMAAYVAINGTEIYYEMDGKGFPLVLVHAGIADSRMWDDQYVVFARQYQTLRYDRRGFGQTRTTPGSFSHHKDLYGLLNSLQIHKAHLVGCSQGAKTILDLALEQAEMAASLTLVAPAVSGFAYDGKPPRQAKDYALAEAAEDIERINELELQIWVDGPLRTPEQVDRRLREKVRQMNGIALRNEAELGAEAELEPPAVSRLDKVHTPTLIINGNLDTPKTQAAAEFLARHIPGVQWVVMPGMAHLPNMEKPDEFNEHVLEFLKNLD